MGKQHPYVLVQYSGGFIWKNDVNTSFPGVFGEGSCEQEEPGFLG